MIRAPGSTVPEMSRYALEGPSCPKVAVVFVPAVVVLFATPDGGDEVGQVQNVQRGSPELEIEPLFDPDFLLDVQVQVALPGGIDIQLVPKLACRRGRDVRSVRIHLGRRQAVYVERRFGVGDQVGVVRAVQSRGGSGRRRRQVVDQAAVGTRQAGLTKSDVRALLPDKRVLRHAGLEWSGMPAMSSG
jgi:hypothetical protein